MADELTEAVKATRCSEGLKKLQAEITDRHQIQAIADFLVYADASTLAKLYDIVKS